MSTGPKTVAEALGQIVWLFSQSPLHRHLKIADLEWSVMPAVLLEQFRVFSFGPLPGLENVRPEDLLPGFTHEGLEQMPLGVAIWGLLSEEAEDRLERGERMRNEDWKSGDRLWLLELISPFSTPENKLTEVMLVDLVNGPFRGRRFSLHKTDPQSGLKHKITLGDPSSEEPAVATAPG
jgi:cytolysin-activating lysine-acyltransferase